MTFLKRYKQDILLILAVVVLAAGFWLVRAATRQAGARVEVRLDGALHRTLSLSEDTELVIGEGAHTNTLVIRDGTARVIAASCPDRVCMDRGEIRFDGETIVCLPNGLVVTVVGGDESGMDGVSQ